MTRRAAVILCVLGAAVRARRAAAAQQCATVMPVTWEEHECVFVYHAAQPPLQRRRVRNPELSSARARAHTQAEEGFYARWSL